MFCQGGGEVVPLCEPRRTQVDIMTTIEQIKTLFETLPEADKSTLKRWLEEKDAELFDAKIEADAAAGRLDGMIAKARANYKSGRRTPL